MKIEYWDSGTKRLIVGFPDHSIFPSIPRAGESVRWQDGKHGRVVSVSWDYMTGRIVIWMSPDFPMAGIAPG
jgi:hypothetical protein